MKAFVVTKCDSSIWHGDLLCYAFAECLKTIGYEVTVRCGEPLSSNEVDSDTFVLVVDLPSLGLLGNGWKGKSYGPIVIYNVTKFHESDICIDRWNKHSWKKATEFFDGRISYIFEYDPLNADRKLRTPVPRISCPIGYHKLFEIRPNMREKYDACFLGWVYSSSYRDIFLKPLVEKYAIRVNTKCGFARNRNLQPLKLVSMDSDRDALMSKVMLNIHTDKNSKVLATPRVIMLGMCNSVCVLSEPVEWKPWGKLPLMVESNRESFLDSLEFLINNRHERKAIADRALEWLKTHYSLELNLRRAMRDSGIL